MDGTIGFLLHVIIIIILSNHSESDVAFVLTFYREFSQYVDF